MKGLYAQIDGYSEQKYGTRPPTSLSNEDIESCVADIGQLSVA